MNALYVTVSITLLLLLAGFNHAHGLTTFGKTNNANNNQAPPLPAKPCGNHTICRGIVGTSCVKDPKEHYSRKSCLCGDNQAPLNGGCQADYRGPNHICTKTSECVEGAKCMPMVKNAGPNSEKVCKCNEGLTDNNNMCSGGSPMSMLSGLIILMAVTRSIIY